MIYKNLMFQYLKKNIRHDAAYIKSWLERLVQILSKLYINVTHIVVNGWPNNSLAIVQWTSTTTLENGDPFLNKGVQFICLKWGKVTELDVY